MCAQLSKCATQSANWFIPPPWARWRIVCTTWWRRPSPPVPRGRRSSPMTEKYREKSRIHPSMLNLPGNHLRWRCHCRRAAQKWCAKACLDAPIWREKICNLCTKSLHQSEFSVNEWITCALDAARLKEQTVRAYCECRHKASGSGRKKYEF